MKTHKSIVLYDIPKDATTEDFVRIAEQMSLTPVIGNLRMPAFIPEGCLYTTNRKVTIEQLCGKISYISFIAAATMFNNSLPMTNWANGKPPCIGEWNATTCAHSPLRRWWNGNHWSVGYDASNNENKKSTLRVIRSSFTIHNIRWRGFAEKPITAGFCK